MMGRQAGGQKKLFYSFNLDDHVPATTSYGESISFSI
jgi:hypothetical protein